MHISGYNSPVIHVVLIINMISFVVKKHLVYSKHTLSRAVLMIIHRVHIILQSLFHFIGHIPVCLLSCYIRPVACLEGGGVLLPDT